MMIRTAMLLSCLYAGNAYAASFVPATQFAATVTPSITASSSGFVYVYQVATTSSSIQNVIEVYVELNNTPVTGTSPEGWNFRVTSGEDITHRGYWAAASPDSDINPGTIRGGFSLRSKFLPSVGPIFLRGNALLPSFEDGEDIPAGTFPASVYDDAVVIMTIVPSSFTVTASADSVERIISLKHQASTLGWIYGPGSQGLIQSLDAKLDAAKSALSRGQTVTASNQLKSFINECKAQRGKKLNENAFLLLSTNAEEIVGKLSP